jgi:hypothetical protein
MPSRAPRPGAIRALKVPAGRTEAEHLAQPQPRCPLFSFCQMPRCLPSLCAWRLGQQGKGT